MTNHQHPHPQIPPRSGSRASPSASVTSRRWPASTSRCPGTVLGVLGPNGAGKTTTVRILTTVLAADGGYAEVLGIDVGRRPDEVRARIGLAGQYAAVDGNLTGRENLRLIGRLTHLGRPTAVARADELLEQLVGPAGGPGPAEVGQPPDQAEVLAPGQVAVDRGVLAGEADPGSHRVGLAGDVEPEDRRRAAVGGDDGGEDPHGRGLAGAVGAEDAEHAAGRYLEVDTGEGLEVAEALRETLDPDGGGRALGDWYWYWCWCCWRRFMARTLGDMLGVRRIFKFFFNRNN